MIVFDLECQSAGHRFEGWFASSEEFARQQERGLVTCPHCGSSHVAKAPMAPAVGRKGNQRGEIKPSGLQPVAHVPPPMPPEAVKMMQALATMQAEALKSSRWVGDKFADEARAIHYGESEAAGIHGEATMAEAKALLEEGIEVAPLPFPVAPPGKAN